MFQTKSIHYDVKLSTIHRTSKIQLYTKGKKRNAFRNCKYFFSYLKQLTITLRAQQKLKRNTRK